MITIDKLSALVEQEFTDCKYAIEEWNNKLKCRLTSDDPIFGGEASTFNDDIAYFCWRCGCNLGVIQDYWDGSETFYISLPATEEEYQNNIKEADKWWKEVN